MGCARSRFKVGNVTLYFSESDDDVGCLCTFPAGFQARDTDTIFSLAMLGAAVRALNEPEWEHATGWHNVRHVAGPDIERLLREALGV